MTLWRRTHPSTDCSHVRRTIKSCTPLFGRRPRDKILVSSISISNRAPANLMPVLFTQLGGIHRVIKEVTFLLVMMKAASDGKRPSRSSAFPPQVYGRDTDTDDNCEYMPLGFDDLQNRHEPLFLSSKRHWQTFVQTGHAPSA